MAGLAEALGEGLDEDFVIGLTPLLLRTPERLRHVDGPALLVTADLDDVLDDWKATKPGRKLGHKVSGWRSLADLAQHEPVAAALERRRTNLPTELANRSPRLGPALQVLLPRLGRIRQNQMNWTSQHDGQLCASIYAHNEILSEGLRLRLTWDGLERWPGLKGPTPVAGKYPVTWLLDAESAVELAQAL